MRTRFKLSWAVLMAVLCGCPNRFYVMYPVQVESTAQLPPQGASPSPAPRDNDRVIPYLTLTAYGYTENFFTMVKQIGDRRFKANKTLVKALDVLFILHADHEQNCSWSAWRMKSTSSAFTSVLFALKRRSPICFTMVKKFSV